MATKKPCILVNSYSTTSYYRSVLKLHNPLSHFFYCQISNKGATENNFIKSLICRVKDSNPSIEFCKTLCLFSQVFGNCNAVEAVHSILAFLLQVLFLNNKTFCGRCASVEDSRRDMSGSIQCVEAILRQLQIVQGSFEDSCSDYEPLLELSLSFRTFERDALEVETIFFLSYSKI